MTLAVLLGGLAFVGAPKGGPAGRPSRRPERLVQVHGIFLRRQASPPVSRPAARSRMPRPWPRTKARTRPSYTTPPASKGDVNDSAAPTLSRPLDGTTTACKSGQRRRLWLGGRLGDDGRHTFGIDVESEEGQRLAAGVAPLMVEAGRLV